MIHSFIERTCFGGGSVLTGLIFKDESAFTLNYAGCQEITLSGENLNPQAPAERS